MPRITLMSSVAVVAVFSVLGASAHAATVTVEPVADTYSSSRTPATTHGSLRYMKSQGSPTRKSYMRFQVAGLGAPVVKATLKVYAYTGATRTGVSARAVGDNSWDERTLTHNDAPALGSELSRTGAYRGGTWVAFDVTPHVQGNGPVSIGLSTISGITRIFAARESSKPPQLIIETSDSLPVPASSLFSPTSYHNQPLANDAPLDPDSQNAVNDLLGMLAEYTEGINTSRWTTRVYTVPADQPTVRVVNDNLGHPALNEAWSAVPLPPGAQPDPEADRQLTVWQPSTDQLWEFWNFYYDATGVPHAEYGGRMCSVSTNPGHFVDAETPCHQEKHWGATATSIPLLAGLIRYEEALALNIPHAIAMAVPKSNCQFRNPAQRTDGGCIPAVQHLLPGARLRLPASLDVDALSCSPLCKAIARAVQRYGFVIRDRAGGIALYGENTGADWNTAIPGGKSLSGFPWDRLQMLPPITE